MRYLVLISLVLIGCINNDPNMELDKDLCGDNEKAFFYRKSISGPRSKDSPPHPKGEIVLFCTETNGNRLKIREWEEIENGVASKIHDLNMRINITETWIPTDSFYVNKINSIDHSDYGYVYGVGFTGFKKIKSSGAYQFPPLYEGRFIYNTMGGVPFDGGGGLTYIYDENRNVKYLEYFAGWSNSTWYTLADVL